MIGKLDERITLERKTLTDDGAGGATESWSAYATVWAEVRAMSGREQTLSMRAEAHQGYFVGIRMREDVLAADRIGWRGRVLNVRAVKYAGPRNMYMLLEAELGPST